MPTANDIIKNALIELRVLAIGEDIPADRVEWSLFKLNAMLESWETERLMCTAVVEENETLTSGTAEYTIGSGGDFDTTRPLEIFDNAFIRIGDTDYPVKRWSLDQYRMQGDKSTSKRPEYFAYQPEYPLGVVYFYKEPDSAYDFHFSSRKPLKTFATATTSVNLEPGWSRALLYGLAIELAPGFGKSVSPELAALSMVSKGNIKRLNGIPRKQKQLEIRHLTNR